MEIKGQIVNVENGTIEPGIMRVEDGKILSIDKTATAPQRFILPGLVDSHVHIESSMLPPSEFARLAVVHGTVATVSDPHEIGNVVGLEGVRFMIGDGKRVPFKFFFGASPCVPATTFESAGATLTSADIAELLANPDIRYLAEMMNFPGVLHGDEEVLKKIASAHAVGKPIDGHAPGLRGDAAARYVAAGISTDHECFTLAEALEKRELGMKILIREGSAAKNFEALWTLVRDFPESTMLCSDDKHPNDLVDGHINQLVKRLIARGVEIFSILRAASYNPIQHYSLPVGICRVGDPADFIVVDSLESFNVLETYIGGECVAREGKSLLKHVSVKPINQFHSRVMNPADFSVSVAGDWVRVIEALNGQIITNQAVEKTPQQGGKIVSDISRDILKITVVNRYQDAPPAVALVKNFGLKRGAIASTVAHDSHNIIAVGVSDDEMAAAVNALMASTGGIVATHGGDSKLLTLPIAGLMSCDDGYHVGRLYQEVDTYAKALGSSLDAPFMTLSFLALLVIPRLKLSDKGLFDGESFTFVNLFLNSEEEGR